MNGIKRILDMIAEQTDSDVVGVASYGELGMVIELQQGVEFHSYEVTLEDLRTKNNQEIVQEVVDAFGQIKGKWVHMNDGALH